MKLSDIEKTLSSMFDSHPKEGHKRHIVFWYDPEGEFHQDIDDIKLPNVQVWKLTGRNYYATKRLLEIEDTSSNFLIYSPEKRPDPIDNWLLDIELYSEHFTADKTLAIMRELGMEDHNLKEVMYKYRKFFRSRERLEKFKLLGMSSYTKRSIETGMMSVLAKQQVADGDAVFRALLCDGLDPEKNDTYNAIKDMIGLEVLEEHAKEKYGYSPADFSLERLAITIFVSALMHQMDVAIPESWKAYVSSKRANCFILVDSFSRQPDAREAYERLALYVSQALNLEGYVAEWDPKDYVDCGIFREFDMAVITRIIEGMLHDTDTFDYWTDLIARRRTTQWYPVFGEIYEALGWAIEVFSLKTQWQSVLTPGNARELFNLYTERYYRMDQAYRKFYLAYDRAQRPDLLRSVRNRVENIYVNWFLQALGVSWSKRVEEELQDGWVMRGVKQQDLFFSHLIPHLSRDGRVFVIISDGLRFEAAEELTGRMRKVFTGTTELKPLQGVLPSLTSMGMAALLPHKNELGIDFSGFAVVDGNSVEGTTRRQAVLEKTGYPSIALGLGELLDMTTDEMRRRLEGRRIVYVYHDRIDDTGHNQNEKDVFQAVDKALDEIEEAVKALRNKVSATNIYITTDHGFIYTRDPLDESDKISGLAIPVNILDRRCALSPEPVSESGILSIRLPHKSPEGKEVYALTPKSYVRFKKPGPGLNYGHGGTSLQEVVIPVIWHRNEKGASRASSKVKLELISTVNRITNRVFTLEFLQLQPVSEEALPRQVVARFVDAAGRAVSNEVKIIADITSRDTSSRLFRERFTLKGTDFDRNAEYYLLIEDPDELVEKEVLRRRFTIDLGITLGFEF
ncbi:MAG TPA: BREX-1 system phosphatase PglZ type A [Bacillota bacterium]|nr:BREX-1 system phosphatase PglZ type A [Bacillota bacterium]